MARYINTVDLCNVVMKTKTEYGRLATLIDNIVEGIVMQTPTADVVEREKIDKAIKIAKDNISVCFKLGLNERAFGMREILEIFEENIGESK